MHWLPAPLGEHQRTGSPSRVCAASRISRVRPHSGTRCRRFIFACPAGTVHTLPSGRSPPTRPTAPHSTWLPSAPGTQGPTWRPAMPTMPAPSGSQQPPPDGDGLHVLSNILLVTKHRADPVAGVVDPVLHSYGPFQDCPQALAHPLGRGCLPVPDRREDLEQIGARDLRDRHLAAARDTDLGDPRVGISGGTAHQFPQTQARIQTLDPKQRGCPGLQASPLQKNPVPFVLFVVRQRFSPSGSPCRCGSAVTLGGPWWSFVCLRGSLFFRWFQDGVAYRTPTNCNVVITASRVKNVPAAASPMRMNQPGRRASGSKVRLTNRVWKQLKPRA